MTDEQLKAALHLEYCRQREAMGIDTEGISRDEPLLSYLLEYARAIEAAVRAAMPAATTLDNWHEDDGHVCWWTWRDGEWLGEPCYIGHPNCEDWPGYHTHWTPHPKFPEAIPATPPAEQGAGS